MQQIIPLAVLVVQLLLTTCIAYSEEFALPLEGGSIIVENPAFIQHAHDQDIPRLTFALVNATSDSWSFLELKFEIDGTCDGEHRQWSQKIVTSLGYFADRQRRRDYDELSIPLLGKVKGCRTERFKVALILAENAKVRIDVVTGERVDLVARRNAEEAQATEQRRIMVVQEAERKEVLAAQEEQRRKREVAQAEERRKREAEDYAKDHAICVQVYKRTSNKKVSDLTVKEEQQVRACQLLGLYQPR